VVCSNAATITGEGSSCTTIFINGTHAFTLGDSTLATQTIKPFLVADLTFSSPGFTRGVSVDGLRMYNACWFSIQRCTFHTLNGAAIYARGGNWDGDVSNNHFQSCGATTGLAAIDVRYSGSLVNNHWKIHDNQFEGTYWSDIYVDGGNLGEDDHKIYANKFGSFEGHNTWTGALDVNQFHVQLYQSTGVTVLDNWFFQGGMVLVKYSYSKIIANHGRELSNGIYIDGSSQQDIDIGANYIAGNNSSDSVTGSLAANHFGVYSWCSNSQFYNNDIVKFNIGIYDRSGSASNSFYLNTGQDSSFNPSLNGSDAKLAGFYQSSTFTPVLSGDSVAGTQSYSGDTAGQYVIFGNLIFFSCVLTVTAFDAACAGNLYIGGLPYEPYIPAGNNLPQFTVQRTNINIGTSTQIQGQLASGSPARLYLLKYTAAGAEGTITKTDCTTNTGIRVSGVYRWKA
jgi:hypothetical protein